MGVVVRLALVLALLGCSIPLTSAQAPRTPTKAEQEALYHEMVKSIRNAVTKSEAKTLSSNLVKRVRVRLFSCSFVYGVIAKRPGISPVEKDWFLMGAALYPRVALALNDTGGSLKSEIEEAAAYAAKQPPTERDAFLFLRGCQDFSNPETMYSAILDIALH